MNQHAWWWSSFSLRRTWALATRKGVGTRQATWMAQATNFNACRKERRRPCYEHLANFRMAQGQDLKDWGPSKTPARQGEEDLVGPVSEHHSQQRTSATHDRDRSFGLKIKTKIKSYSWKSSHSEIKTRQGSERAEW